METKLTAISGQLSAISFQLLVLCVQLLIFRKDENIQYYLFGPGHWFLGKGEKKKNVFRRGAVQNCPTVDCRLSAI
jgi:hypothetical protein